MIGLYKTELIRKRGPWRSVQDVELATLEWVWWFNHHRLLGPLGHVPPVQYEEDFLSSQQPATETAGLTPIGLR